MNPIYLKLFSLFSSWLEKQPYASNTKEVYLRIIKSFLFYLDIFGIMRIKDVNKDLLFQFLTKRGSKLYAKANINLRHSVLSLFYAWAYANRYCQTNPVIEYRKAKLHTKPFPKKILKTNNDIIILTIEEQLLLTIIRGKDDFTTARNRCIINLILAGALYAKELTSLLIKDINLENGYMVVRSKKAKARKVEINHNICKSCQKWLAVRANTLHNQKFSFLFFSRKIKQLTKRMLHEIISKYMLEAGINKAHLGPEVLRQTAISNMLSSGKTIEEVQTITGIRTLKNIQKYKRAISD